MKLLSTVLQRGNSLMFTNKNIDFINDQDISSDNSPNLLWFKYNENTFFMQEENSFSAKNII